jgi:hypothetical protein
MVLDPHDRDARGPCPIDQGCGSINDALGVQASAKNADLKVDYEEN